MGNTVKQLAILGSTGSIGRQTLQVVRAFPHLFQVIGLAAGIIGGAHRFWLGGLTAVPCGLSTMLSGLTCGVIYRLRGGKLIGTFQGMLIAILVEFSHMGIILLISRPFSDAFTVVESVTLPMVAANSIGMFLCIRAIVYKFGSKANTE